MMDAVWAGLLPRSARWRTVPVADAPLHQTRHGERGEPLWPAGIVGSITHAGDLRTVATAPAAQIGALGIDMEPLTSLPPAVWPRIFDKTELEELLFLPAPQRGIAALGRWCLKEALFKALQGHVPLDELSLRQEGGAWRPSPALHAVLLRAGVPAPGRLTLRAAAAGSWLCAAAWYHHQTEN